jgi:hypothetical protein
MGARWPTSGLQGQDNDLIVIESTEAAAFKSGFDMRFAGGEALVMGAK